LPIGDKKSGGPALFDNFSQGVLTARDTWAYNSSRKALAKNMRAMIGFYNQELERFDAVHHGADRKAREVALDDFIDTDPSKISWTHNIKQELVRGLPLDLEDGALTYSLYRPFTPQWLFYSRDLNERVYQMPRLFPMGEAVKNRVIQTTGSGAADFTALMSVTLPNYDNLQKGQCFPRYLYDEQAQASDDDLFADGEAAGLKRRDALTDEGLAYFQAAYPGEMITKDDLFYYVYGLLHSQEYRNRFADNLSKELPRIPAVKQAKDFWAFVEAGRVLGDLHCSFESVEPYPVTFEQGALELAHIPDPVKFYRVEKMKFHKVRNKEGKLEPDKSTVIYNSNITMTGIPLEAYDYVVNGKAALDWVMERQCVKTDKKSGIVNDANAYANETVGDPAYPLKLFQRVITVSLETIKIVRSLPKLELPGDESETNSTSMNDLEKVKAAIAQHWRDHYELVTLANSIVDSFGRDFDPDQTLFVGDILDAVGQQSFTPDIAAALAILTQSRFAILNVDAIFIDDGGERHALSPKELETLLSEDMLAHPRTGEAILEASKEVVLAFRLHPDFLREVAHEL